ncbi:hypothetical protein [Mycoplasmopsis verecunda]|uniref:Uncharacterized protein n=1 Tax=Mycoplasmopsis verecunda TaxID=171291 RepID=A0A1T4LVL9_9BACT|nr:hypothetical protein [Mycoplasmopsis verecunda]WPB54524.1 hypothetical protein SAM46_03565 [Mycoplasmopsis verecunda]SJZ58548.1 hypothetical protein SAMN02745154_00549 [Mycoplasmopsis verecunda]
MNNHIKEDNNKFYSYKYTTDSISTYNQFIDNIILNSTYWVLKGYLKYIDENKILATNIDIKSIAYIIVTIIVQYASELCENKLINDDDSLKDEELEIEISKLIKFLLDNNRSEYIRLTRFVEHDNKNQISIDYLWAHRKRNNISSINDINASLLNSLFNHTLLESSYFKSHNLRFKWNIDSNLDNLYKLLNCVSYKAYKELSYWLLVSKKSVHDFDIEIYINNNDNDINNTEEKKHDIPIINIIKLHKQNKITNIDNNLIFDSDTDRLYVFNNINKLNSFISSLSENIFYIYLYQLSVDDKYNTYWVLNLSKYFRDEYYTYILGNENIVGQFRSTFKIKLNQLLNYIHFKVTETLIDVKDYGIFQIYDSEMKLLINDVSLINNIDGNINNNLFRFHDCDTLESTNINGNLFGVRISETNQEYEDLFLHEEFKDITVQFLKIYIFDYSEESLFFDASDNDEIIIFITVPVRLINEQISVTNSWDNINFNYLGVEIRFSLVKTSYFLHNVHIKNLYINNLNSSMNANEFTIINLHENLGFIYENGADIKSTNNFFIVLSQNESRNHNRFKEQETLIANKILFLSEPEFLQHFELWYISKYLKRDIDEIQELLQKFISMFQSAKSNRLFDDDITWLTERIKQTFGHIIERKGYSINNKEIDIKMPFWSYIYDIDRIYKEKKDEYNFIDIDDTKYFLSIFNHIFIDYGLMLNFDKYNNVHESSLNEKLFSFIYSEILFESVKSCYNKKYVFFTFT